MIVVVVEVEVEAEEGRGHYVHGRGEGDAVSPALAALEAYVASCGGGAPIQRTRLAMTRDMGVGVVATERIRRGETYIAIPRSCTISHERVLADPDFGKTARLLDRKYGVDVERDLKLYLIRERRKGDGSELAAYISSLPQTFHTPLFFGKETLRLLKGSPVYAGALRDRRKARDTFMALGAEAGRVGWREWQWATGVIQSRRINVQGAPGRSPAHLIPYIDMLNCREDANPARMDRTFTGYDASMDAIVMHADHDAAPGEQMFETYGWKTQEELFRFNGFVLEGNPKDCTNIVDTRAPEDDPLVNAVLEAGRIPLRYAQCVPASARPREWLAWAGIWEASMGELRRLLRALATGGSGVMGRWEWRGKTAKRAEARVRSHLQARLDVNAPALAQASQDPSQAPDGGDAAEAVNREMVRAFLVEERRMLESVLRHLSSSSPPSE